MPSPEEQAAPTTTPSVGVFNFSFDRFVVRKAFFEELPRTKPEQDEKRPPVITTRTTLQVNCLMRNDKRALVTLNASVLPDPKWQPYRIEVSVTGMFSSKDATGETFDQFVRFAAPTILFPYVRQVIQGLTTDAAFGLVRINPINVQDLIVKQWLAEQREEAAPVEAGDVEAGDGETRTTVED